MDTIEKQESSAGVSSAKKRKTGFLFEEFIPFSEDSPLPNSTDEDKKPSDFQRKIKVKKERPAQRLTNGKQRSNGQRSNNKTTSSGDSLVENDAPGGLTPKPESYIIQKPMMGIMSGFMIDQGCSRASSSASQAKSVYGEQFLNRNKRRKLKKKERRLGIRSADPSTGESVGRADCRADCRADGREFVFKPPVLITMPVSSAKLKNVSYVKLENVAQTTPDEKEESAENQRTSFCQSEESIDLNDLRGMVGFNDFDDCDLKQEEDSSSYSSYSTLLYDSDEAECDPDFGCVSLNIDINKKRRRSRDHEFTEDELEEPVFLSKVTNQSAEVGEESDTDESTTEQPEVEEEIEIADEVKVDEEAKVGKETEVINCDQSQQNNLNYFNYSNPLYVNKPAPKSSQSPNDLPNGPANAQPKHHQETIGAPAIELMESSPSDDDDVVFVGLSNVRNQLNSSANAQPNALSNAQPNAKPNAQLIAHYQTANASRIDPMKILFPSKEVDFVDLSKPYCNPDEVYPWVNPDRAYSWGIIGLHEEIEGFYEYSRLKRAEVKVRNLLFMRVKDVVLSRWPGAEVLVFGSFQTGLSLPFADLDVVVFVNLVSKIPFHYLEAKLVQEGITTYDNVKIITRATVPIIRFVHKQTGLSVDMSFNSEDGPRAISLIQGYIRQYPALPKLLLIIKLLLHRRGLNFSYTGGLSSYTLTLMFVNFFQLHPRANVSQDGSSNLGVLLLEFLELYGFTFDSKILAIRVRNYEGFVRKNEMSCLNDHEMTLNRLCVEDPLDQFNNPSKNSHRWEEVRSTFRHAFNMMAERCKVSEPLYDADQKSILSELIGYTTGEVELRERVLEFHGKELETFEEKRDKKRDKKQRRKFGVDLNSDFIPFSVRVPDKPLGGFQPTDYAKDSFIGFR